MSVQSLRQGRNPGNVAVKTANYSDHGGGHVVLAPSLRQGSLVAEMPEDELCKYLSSQPKITRFRWVLVKITFPTSSLEMWELGERF